MDNFLRIFPASQHENHISEVQYSYFLCHQQVEECFIYKKYHDFDTIVVMNSPKSSDQATRAEMFRSAASGARC
jgi:hypothetical protein